MKAMLTIRREQFRAVGEAMQRRFELQSVARLRAAFPGQTREASDEQLLDLIRTGIGRAAGYGITTEADVTRYLEYVILYGRDFDSKLVWAAKILRTEGIGGGRKMDLIDEYNLFMMRPEPSRGSPQ
jgi:hypothetical protein